MNIPFKQMLQWKTGNFAPTILGIWYIIVPFLAGAKTVNQAMAIFGFTFLSIGIINAKSKPTVLASLFSALIGISYVFGMLGTYTLNTTIFWSISVILFILVLVFEFDIFKLGPSSSSAKVLTVIPLALLGFCIILGLAGYNPLIKFDFTRKPLVAFNYLAVMTFCWLYVFDYAGYRPFGAKTNTWMNIMALAAVLLSLVGVYQGSLFQW
jgi:hypothetical protein